MKSLVDLPKGWKLFISYLLGTIWSLPVQVVGILNILLHFVCFEIKFSRREWFFFEFVLREKKGILRGVFKMWRNSGAMSIGLFNIYKSENLNDPQMILHERRHSVQVLFWGSLWPVVYGVFFVWIKFFDTDMHPYWSNPFERDARRHAGQVYIYSQGYYYPGPNDPDVVSHKPEKVI